MNNKFSIYRRLLSFVLAAVLMLTLLPIMALAADEVELVVTYNVSDDNNQSGGVTGSGMHYAVNTALSARGVTASAVTKITLIGNATEITNYNWLSLSYLFCSSNTYASAWTGLTSLDLSGMTSLTYIGINDSATYTANFGINRLIMLALPGSLTTIGYRAFWGCTNLALTALPSGVTSIGEYAFYGCTNLALTALPSGITSIEDYTFTSCASLALTALPSGVTSIGRKAFWGCTNLALAALPSGVTTIGKEAFYGCTNLALTTLPYGITSIEDYTFFRCTNLALIALPNGIVTIGNCAFYDCTNLALTALPNGIVTIGNSAFNSCSSITEIQLPSSLTAIEGQAFLYSHLNIVEFTSPSAPTIGERAFGNTYDVAFVPDTATGGYEDAAFTNHFYVVLPAAVRDVIFTVQNRVDLNSPVDLVFSSSDSLSLASCDIVSVSVENSAGDGYDLYAVDGISYNKATGTVTIPATVFDQNQGSALTPGTYTAKITFSAGRFSPVYTFTLDYSAAFELYNTAATTPVLERGDHIKYLNGYTDGSIRPDNNITRAEAAAIFFRLIADENKDAPLTAGFSDVEGGAWCYQALAYLEKYGIIEGYSDGTFRPNAKITRAEFAVIASRFDKLETDVPDQFDDVSDTHWAADYIGSAVAKGWVSGFPDGTFRPNDNITRAQVVTIVNHMLDRKIELADIPVGGNNYTDLSSIHWAYCDVIEASVEHEYARKENGYELWQ